MAHVFHNVIAPNLLPWDCMVGLTDWRLKADLSSSEQNRTVLLVSMTASYCQRGTWLQTSHVAWRVAMTPDGLGEIMLSRHQGDDVRSMRSCVWQTDVQNDADWILSCNNLLTDSLTLSIAPAAGIHYSLQLPSSFLFVCSSAFIPLIELRNCRPQKK